MTGALPDFGAIIVTVDTKDGVPVSARTRSTRRSDGVKAAGRPSG